MVDCEYRLTNGVRCGRFVSRGDGHCDEHQSKVNAAVRLYERIIAYYNGDSTNVDLA